MHHFYVPSTTIEADPELRHLLGRSNLWVGSGRASLGVLARRDNTSVWTQELFTFTESDNETVDVPKLQAKYIDFEPAFQRILSYASNVATWKLATVDALSNSWVSASGKVMLIGDAAHAMLPYFGQGAEMGIEDGATIAEYLARTSDVSDIPSVIRAVEALRQHRVTLVQIVATQSAQMMILPNVEMQRVRDEMFRKQADSAATWDGISIDTGPASKTDPTLMN